MIFKTPNERCISLLNERWREIVREVFADNKVNFSDDIRLTFCDKEIVRLYDCTVINGNRECCVLTEHNGYHVFFLDEEHKLEVLPKFEDARKTAFLEMTGEQQDEYLSLFDGEYLPWDEAEKEFYAKR